MRSLETATRPRYAGGSHKATAAKVLTPGEAAVLGMEGFETPPAVEAEDQLRRQALLDYMPIVGPVGWRNIGAVLKQAAAHIVGRPLTRLDRRRALAFARKLDPDDRRPTVASAVAMRRFRINVIGGLIEALADYPDEELCTITIVKPAWVFTPAELSKVSARTIKRAFEQDLRRAGVADFDGPFVGFLHGEYEPTSGVYVLHYHCVTTREKADYVVRRLRRLKRTYRAKGIVKRPIRISKMKNRVGQLTYLLKRYWPSRPILTIDGVERRVRRTMRVPEPYSCAYLLWLDQQPFIDLTVSKGTWSPRKRGSAAWKAFYLIVGGVGREQASDG